MSEGQRLVSQDNSGSDSLCLVVGLGLPAADVQAHAGVGQVLDEDDEENFTSRFRPWPDSWRGKVRET